MDVCGLGYLLLPDFASTGFMMQGASLLATLVDCGNVDSIGGIHTMVNAYLIPSRVKNASGLALLRAFSSQLFSNGSWWRHVWLISGQVSKDANSIVSGVRVPFCTVSMNVRPPAMFAFCMCELIGGKKESYNRHEQRKPNTTVWLEQIQATF